MSVFEIVRGVEGDCLVLDGTRICGSKPWGGGRIIKTFHTDGIYEVIDKDEYHKLQAENAKLRELLKVAYRCTNAGPSCLECRMVAGGCTLLSAMRELGVDVP